MPDRNIDRESLQHIARKLMEGEQFRSPGMFALKFIDAIVEADWRRPARAIATAEELDTLDWPCLVREITPADELEFYPQIWERAFQTDGWCRVGQMFDEEDCTPRLPVEVLPEPKETDRA
ncbi:hypothetical protein [Nocardia tengchongensis]|uniref:hypothetical protein n=1 Tax=Nocardia tengchongensis TaxID=2055889 RepID=UPI0036BB86BA